MHNVPTPTFRYHQFVDHKNVVSYKSLFTVCRLAATQMLPKQSIAAPTIRSSFFPPQQCGFTVRTMFSSLSPPPSLISSNKSLLVVPSTLCAAQPSRNVTKFSLKKGKRKSVKPVLKRFMRLDWGGWIRTRQGRHKKMWKKTGSLKRRLRQHVLVNGTQAWLLDKMVTKFWRRPKYYVDDPYRPYHSRNEYPNTRKTPIEY